MTPGYLFLFHTSLGAIKLKKALAARDVAFRVIDAPRRLTAECGVAVAFTLDGDEAFRSFLNQDVSAVYRVGDGEPALLWQDER